ncbi:MAG: hypothetical protein AAF850_03685 [Pseudomonadota bacterium]
MSNGQEITSATLKLHLVDGGLLPIEIASGKEFIKLVFGDDFSAPPQTLSIEVEMNDGRQATVSVPYGGSNFASVSVD